MNQLLRSLFPPLLPSRRSRPEELLYWVEDRPGLPTLLLLGGQHALLALMFSLYAVIAGQAMGLDGPGLMGFVSTSVFAAGLVTLLHGLRTRFTTGMLQVGLPSPVAIGVFAATTLTAGLSVTMGALVVSSLIVMLIARLMPRLRPVFPPEVVGAVVLTLGLSMVPGAILRGTGLANAGAGGGLAWAPVIAAAITLAIIVILSIWSTRRLRIMAVLLGTVGGTAVALLLGAPSTAPGLVVPANLGWFALPMLGHDLPLPNPFHPAILPIVLVQVISALGGLADALTVDKLNDGKWLRADMAMAGRAVNTIACVNLLCGLAGCLPVATSSSNIGLMRATGATARRIGIAAGVIMMALACLPPVSRLIVGMPNAVIGAILLYTAAYLITAGLELSLSRLLDTRRSFVIGFAVVAGAAVMMVPQLAQSAPDWARPIAGSGVVVTAIVAVLLNLLFRIGTARNVRTTLPEDAAEASIAAADFLEHHGRAWGARRDVIARAGHAVGEALEILRHAGLPESQVTLAVRFDEFNLLCTLSYAGAPLQLGADAAPDLHAALEGDDEAMEAAMRRLSLTLVRRLADRVQASTEQGRAVLRLHFAH